MSLFNYQVSQRIAAEDYPFHALIMAAARKADTDNFNALKRAFPFTMHELELRYNAPGGRLEADGPVDPHADHGRGTVEEGPNDPDCSCRGTEDQEVCAMSGCGFCKAAS